MENACVFKNVLGTCSSKKKNHAKELSEVQKTKIRSSSKLRKDKFLVIFETLGEFKFHQDCYCEYTSKQKIERFKAKKRKEESENVSSSSTKRLRR